MRGRCGVAIADDWRQHGEAKMEKRVFLSFKDWRVGSRGKLTEARESWLSILIWLGRCSIGGEKGGPGGRRRFWEEDGDRLRVL
jgi:hypothetical protein